MTFDALFIPHDFSKRPAQVRIYNVDQLNQLVQGQPERAVYDYDAETWMNANGIEQGLPRNLGASGFSAQYTAAGRQFEAKNGRPPNIGLHGNVVITGNHFTDVPQRILDEFPNKTTMNVNELIEDLSHGHGRGHGY